MPKLERLRAEHHDAVLAFESDNRTYFAASVSDRGDDFFDRYTEGFEQVLAEQHTGRSAFFVLVDSEGDVLGRFNLYDIQDGTANAGYRVAERVAGRGLATATLRELCETAVGLGVHTLFAATSHQNVASQHVLAGAGFVPVGPAGPAALGGKYGTRYRRELRPVT